MWISWLITWNLQKRIWLDGDLTKMTYRGISLASVEPLNLPGRSWTLAKGTKLLKKRLVPLNMVTSGLGRPAVRSSPGAWEGALRHWGELETPEAGEFGLGGTGVGWGWWLMHQSMLKQHWQSICNICNLKWFWLSFVLQSGSGWMFYWLPRAAFQTAIRISRDVKKCSAGWLSTHVPEIVLNYGNL